MIQKGSEHKPEKKWRKTEEGEKYKTWESQKEKEAWRWTSNVLQITLFPQQPGICQLSLALSFWTGLVCNTGTSLAILARWA